MDKTLLDIKQGFKYRPNVFCINLNLKFFLHKEKTMPAKILSPMPGKIIEILVKEGDTVLDGQELLVLEAMKMENPICASCDGTIKEIAVSMNDQVATKQLLAIIG